MRDIERATHHRLVLMAYEQSFDAQNLVPVYKVTQLRRLNDVFSLVYIADPARPGVYKQVDSFDLINPKLANTIKSACERDLPSKQRKRECFKAIRRYCSYLKENPSICLPKGRALYIPEVYGPIESPITRYDLPRQFVEPQPNFRYLQGSEYRLWLTFTWQQTRADLPVKDRLRAYQLHLMCVIAGEMGLRIQEILALQPEHFYLEDKKCLIIKGKGSRGSGHRKRLVPVTDLVKETLLGFYRQFPRKKGEPLFQTVKGTALAYPTAYLWLDELKRLIRIANLPILIDEKRFGWHAFRRTYANRYIENGGKFHDLKQNTGWSYTSTIACYMGCSKASINTTHPPLYYRGIGHGD